MNEISMIFESSMISMRMISILNLILFEDSGDDDYDKDDYDHDDDDDDDEKKKNFCLKSPHLT